MYKRDLITSEIQKLAEALARIMGLKHNGKPIEAAELLAVTLEEKFGISTAALEDEDLFNAAVEDLLPDKLDMLSQFLYNELNPEAEYKNRLLAKRLQHLYKLLEDKHRTINLEHINRLRHIQQYL